MRKCLRARVRVARMKESDKIFCDPVQFSLLFLFFCLYVNFFFKVKFFSEMDKREKNIMLPSLERSMSRVCKQYGCNREVVVVVVLVRTREVEGIIMLLKVFFRLVMVI